MNLQSFVEFNRNSIKLILKAWSKNIDAIVADVPNGTDTKNAIPGMNIRPISTWRLVVATNAVKYYTAIGRTPEFDNMHYVNVLGGFNTDYNAYVLLKKHTYPK